MRLVALTLVAVGVAGAVLASCGTTDEWFYSCPHPDEPLLSDIAADGTQDPCHRRDAGSEAGSDECPREACFSQAPAFWSGPYLIWSGSNGSAPACPYGRDQPYAGYDDLVAPPECEPCSCGPSIGACSLPSQLTAHDVTCNDVGLPHNDTAFDAPPSWKGKCDTTDPVQAGTTKSLTIAPVKIENEHCSVLPPLPSKIVSPRWNTLAIGCAGITQPCSDGGGSLCMRKPGPEWRVCVVKEGEVDCPDDNMGHWSYRHVYYDIQHGYDDQRSCTDCACGPPQGSMCTAQLSAYTDLACKAPVDGAYTIASTGPKCVDIIPPGQPLTSKSATTPIYIPGTCNVIPGVVTGTITKINPSTVCCESP